VKLKLFLKHMREKEEEALIVNQGSNIAVDADELVSD
jgi:hypothetical protein